MPALNGYDQIEAARRRSVKQGDNTLHGATVLQLFVPVAQTRAMLPPNLPYTLWVRDRFLSLTPRADAQWGCAVGVGVTKVASLAWDVESEVNIRSKRAREIMHHADSANSNGGWVQYIAKQVRDYTCTNNGCVTEIVRKTRAYGSQLVGINHLPSVRCRRTGDPERPFIYIGRDNVEHVLRWWQVMYFSDMPDPDEETYGGGLCAAERAYSQIIKMAAIENFVYEKVSATRPLAVHIISGVRTEQLEDAIRNAEQQQMEEGMTSYMGAVIMASIKPDTAPGLVTIPLAELPDGFDAAAERSRSDLVYANALGLDLQDITPLSNTPFGTGQQSRTLHEKAKGKGLMMFRQAFVHGMNELVLDSKTKFLFTERDLEDQRRRALVSHLKARVAELRIKAGITRSEEERQLMVDDDELPNTFISRDLTPGTTYSDTDKPAVDEPPTVVSANAMVVPEPAAPREDNSIVEAGGETTRKSYLMDLSVEPRLLDFVERIYGSMSSGSSSQFGKMMQAFAVKAGAITDDYIRGKISVDDWESAISSCVELCSMWSFADGARVEKVYDLKGSQLELCLSSMEDHLHVLDNLSDEVRSGRYSRLPHSLKARALMLSVCLYKSWLLGEESRVVISGNSIGPEGDDI